MCSSFFQKWEVSNCSVVIVSGETAVIDMGSLAWNASASLSAMMPVDLSSVSTPFTTRSGRCLESAGYPRTDCSMTLPTNPLFLALPVSTPALSISARLLPMQWVSRTMRSCLVKL